VQHEHAHIRSGIARGNRLAMSPDPEHRIAAARIELGYDDDLHQRRWVVSVRCASSALTYGLSAKNSRASAIASARE